MAKVGAEMFKRSTGLTGLAPAKNPSHTLTVLYNKILRALNQMPANSAYRINTEVLVKERAQVVQNSKTVPEIEKGINCGQVEEVILQAEKELLLARKMLGWKPWEQLVSEAPATQWIWPPKKPVKQA